MYFSFFLSSFSINCLQSLYFLNTKVTKQDVASGGGGKGTERGNKTPSFFRTFCFVRRVFLQLFWTVNSVIYAMCCV